MAIQRINNMTIRELLRETVDDSGNTIAHCLAKRGLWFDPDKDMDILLLQNSGGWTVAHCMAESGYIFDPDRYEHILKLQGNTDDDGYLRIDVSVAHIMAEKGYKFDPEKHGEILRLTDGDEETVAHYMVKAGHTFDPDKHLDVLSLENYDGETVAHYMAKAGYIFDPEKHLNILMWKNSEGLTVAHYMVKAGYAFNPDKHLHILKLKDDSGLTVACYMAINGYVFDFSKLKDALEEDIKYQIAEAMVIHGNYLFDPSKCEEEFGWDNKFLDKILYKFVRWKRDNIIGGCYDDRLLGLSVESLERYKRTAEKVYSKFRKQRREKKIYQKVLARLDDLLRLKRKQMEMVKDLSNMGLRA